MSTYTQIMYHIVFSTKYRKPTLLKEFRPILFKFICGIMKEKQCHLYRINGVEDHIHILTHLHPSVALASLVKDIKLASTDLIKRKSTFPNFYGWQKGYSAFTHSIKERHRLIEYVKNQESHHSNRTYLSELEGLLREHGVKFDKKYLS